MYYIDPKGDLTPNALSIKDGTYVFTTPDGSREVSEVSEGVSAVRFVPGSNDGSDFCVELQSADGPWSYTPQGSATEGGCEG